MGKHREHEDGGAQRWGARRWGSTEMESTGSIEMGEHGDGEHGGEHGDWEYRGGARRCGSTGSTEMGRRRWGSPEMGQGRSPPPGLKRPTVASSLLCPTRKKWKLMVSCRGCCFPSEPYSPRALAPQGYCQLFPAQYCVFLCTGKHANPAREILQASCPGGWRKQSLSGRQEPRWPAESASRQTRHEDSTLHCPPQRRSLLLSPGTASPT